MPGLALVQARIRSSTSVLLAAPASAPDEPLLGFTRAGSAEQRALEQRYDGLLRAENLREFHGAAQEFDIARAVAAKTTINPPTAEESLAVDVPPLLAIQTDSYA